MNSELREERQPIYTSRIIKASALISDSKILLTTWDMELSIAENLVRSRHENIFGKASDSRVEDILTLFRQRFFTDPAVGSTLVKLVQNRAPNAWVDPLLYFFAAQNDRTLRDLVIDVLYPRQQSGYNDVPIEYVTRTLRDWVDDGKTTSPWGDETIARVAQGILATLRDFGVLQGKVHKQITPFYLPTPAFALVAHWLLGLEHSGERVLQSDEWKLFFLPVAGVERFFIEAHQEHLLGYQAAGSIVRIDFPANDLTEYANVLLESAR